MATNARIYVPPPAAQPAQYGLLSAVQIRPAAGGAARIPGVGIDFQSPACGTTYGWPDPCGDAPPYSDRTITVTLTAAEDVAPDVEITAGASVSGGPVRTVEVSLDGGAPTTITTGAPATSLGTTFDASTSYAVQVRDVNSRVRSTGTLTVDGAGDGELVLTIDVRDFTPKTIDEGMPVGTAEPFSVYTSLNCKNVDIGEVSNFLRERLALSEGRGVEAAFWTGSLGQYPALATDPDVITAPAAGSVVAAIGALEQKLAERYGGIGVIHAPRSVMPYLADANLIVRDGQTQLRTPLGTRLAFYSGTDGTVGPTGSTPVVPGQVWLYATGAIVAYQGEVDVLPEGGAALNRTTNEVILLAERPWTLARDCVTIAVKATVESYDITVVDVTDDQTISASGTSAPIDLAGYDEGLLSVFAAGTTGSPTLTVSWEMEDSDGNWIPVTSLTQLTSAPNYAYANIGDAPAGYVFTGRGRVAWTKGGTGTFTGVDITLALKRE